jgi:hypothetical protein
MGLRSDVAHTGRLDKGSDEDKTKGLTVVSIKDDSQSVFPLEKK